MKLTIEHLAPYLPYGVKVQHSNKIDIANGYYTTNSKDIWITTMQTGSTIINSVKPILYRYNDIIEDDEILTCDDLQKCCFSYTQDLLKKHIDVFGLIDANLAVDGKTLTP